MRFSVVHLQAIQRQVSASRSKSISFLGLGRMGSEMAFNLFSKQLSLSTDTSFAVCDAVPEAALSFANNFHKHFPGTLIRIVDTPEQ